MRCSFDDGGRGVFSTFRESDEEDLVDEGCKFIDVGSLKESWQFLIPS